MTDQLMSGLKSAGFPVPHSLTCNNSPSISSAYFVTSPGSTDRDTVNVINLRKPAKEDSAMKTGLEAAGWSVKEHQEPQSFGPKGITLVIDKPNDPILPTISREKWEALKKLVFSGNRLLWVSEGSQMKVTNPDGAMVHGLTRSIRSEDPSINITTLDVERESGPETASAIDSVLRILQGPTPKKLVESEYVERDGIIHVCRMQPDELVNHREKEKREGADAVTVPLHRSPKCIRMVAERLGTIDSLQYIEVAPHEMPLRDNCVEVDIKAAGLNFKV